MARKKRQPCPAGIEDRCPIPRYRCREVGEPGKHCFELFEEFEAFVFPEVEDADEEAASTDTEDSRASAMPHPRNRTRT